RPFLVALDEEWVGLSLTMPLKRLALEVADEVSPLAAVVGAANTLLRRDDRWFADNTDVGGMVDAMQEAGLERPQTAGVLGAGGTARARGDRAGGGGPGSGPGRGPARGGRPAGRVAADPGRAGALRAGRPRGVPVRPADLDGAQGRRRPACRRPAVARQ